MAIIRGVKDVLSWTPRQELLKPVKQRMVFRFRTPRVSDVPKVKQAALAVAGVAYQVTEAELEACVKTGIREMFAVATEGPAVLPELTGMSEVDLVALRDKALALMAKFYEIRGQDPSGLSDQEVMAHKAVIDAAQSLESKVRLRDPDFARLMQTREDYAEAFWAQSVRRYCIGADNLDLGEIDTEGLTDEQLDMVPPPYIAELGTMANSTTKLTDAELKKLSSPSRTSNTPKTTRAAKGTARKTRPKKTSGRLKRSASKA